MRNIGWLSSAFFLSILQSGTSFFVSPEQGGDATLASQFGVLNLMLQDLDGGATFDATRFATVKVSNRGDVIVTVKFQFLTADPASQQGSTFTHSCHLILSRESSDNRAVIVPQDAPNASITNNARPSANPETCLSLACSECSKQTNNRSPCFIRARLRGCGCPRWPSIEQGAHALMRLLFSFTLVVLA